MFNLFRIFKKEKERTPEEIIEIYNSGILEFFGEKRSLELSKLIRSEKRKRELEMIEEMLADLKIFEKEQASPNVIYGMVELFKKFDISEKQYVILTHPLFLEDLKKDIKNRNDLEDSISEKNQIILKKNY